MLQLSGWKVGQGLEEKAGQSTNRLGGRLPVFGLFLGRHNTSIQDLIFAGRSMAGIPCIP